MTLGEFKGVVDAPDGQHAHRTSRPMDEAHVSRHQVVHAITEDRVGVSAAELHDGVAAPGFGLAAYGGGQTVGQLLVAELVDVLHGRPLLTKLSLRGCFLSQGERTENHEFGPRSFSEGEQALDFPGEGVRRQ